jgi:hypothetical protein
LSGRRGFLALVGGAFVSGGVRVGQAARPTLLLPPNGLVSPSAAVVRSRSPVLDFSRVLDGLPADMYEDWMAGGLRCVESCKRGGNIHRAALTEGRDVAAEVEQARADYARHREAFLTEIGFGEYARSTRTTRV